MFDRAPSMVQGTPGPRSPLCCCRKPAARSHTSEPQQPGPPGIGAPRPVGEPGPSGEEAYELVKRGAVEALLGPGDALFFPADWAHHIESGGDLSVALSLREVDGALVGT